MRLVDVLAVITITIGFFVIGYGLAGIIKMPKGIRGLKRNLNTPWEEYPQASDRVESLCNELGIKRQSEEEDDLTHI